MFGDDFFDEIERAFFGSAAPRTSSSGNFVRSESEERFIDYIKEDDGVYLVFELPGYSEEDINVKVHGNVVEIDASKKPSGDIKPYLAEKLSEGIFFKRALPKGVKAKKLTKTFKNGVLELRFARR